ncbi:hypothetical protein DH2020_003291 [Rehmannia glutinosa]|uniref:GCK domain-containing protein n=1 Tax=Rehmannia glutinosa TaxID=99300 RepID=A0ABR0XL76_REHGL
MGDFLSTPSQPNYTSSPTAIATATMSSSNSHQPNSTPQPKIPESETPIEKNSDPPTDPKTAGAQENPAEKETLSEEKLAESIKDGDGDEEGEEEEEGECGFCLFMKGGGCKETFVDWEKCVEEGEKNKEDIVEKCFQATAALKKCMEAHSDYYAPLLQAEKAAEEEAAKQLEDDREKLNDQGRGAEVSGNKENLSGSDNQK